MATIGLRDLYRAPITVGKDGEETYGTPVRMAKAISAEMSVEVAEAILYADDGEEQLTEKQVGKMIHTGNFNEVKTAIFKAFAMGNSGTTEPPQDDEDDEPEYAEEERKNAQAGKE